MGRNDDRLEAGLPIHDESIAPGVATTLPSNEPAQFNWTVPTEFIELPSQGRFYSAAHPLHNAITVEIRYMTAKDEDILTSRALLKEGVAIDRLLQNILVNKNIDVNSLLVGDKNALIVGARITGYGATYETKVTCPACSTSSDYSFELHTEPKQNGIEQTLEEYEAVTTDHNTFVVKLPLTQVTVECRLMTGKDELQLMKEGERRVRRKMQESGLTDQLKAFIVSVNGDNSPLAIASLIQNLPAQDSRFLRTFYSEITPNIDLTQVFECSSCGYSADMEVPLTADFFWPRR